MLGFGVLVAVMAVVVSVNSKTTIPCGLPPFVTKLPQKQADQLKEAWAKYQNGSACVDEQKRTFEIVGSLTEAERAAVFEFKTEPIEVEDHFDTTPHFIQSLSAEVKEGFDAIWTNASLKEDDKHNKLSEYADKNFNAEQKTDFEQWLSEIKKAKKAVDDRIKSLSPKAKEVLDRIVKLREEEHEILHTMTPETAKELYGLI
ncbi:unnamed protein product [Heligmosomoides polygyrus]|uniref:DUF148 domain-containing protein n=1 Tax=Heligmosomoides polygyrus TaxID=6339 RepID=A0A183FXJ2_HELPZ|nr:unnamed protein product [Heligmosomoides polygyrus]